MNFKLVSYDDKPIRTSLEKAVPKVNGLFAENVLADCKEYVPYDTGALQRSGRTFLKDTDAYVEWGTDGATAAYARVQYEGNFSHATVGNALYAPRAQSHWFEAAKRDNGSRWDAMYDHLLKSEVGD